MKIDNLYKFFDHFGLIVFLFLTVDSLLFMQDGDYGWRVVTRLLIGIGGLVVDGFLVFIYKER
jgi:hypothetical protein